MSVGSLIRMCCTSDIVAVRAYIRGDQRGHSAPIIVRRVYCVDGGRRTTDHSDSKTCLGARRIFAKRQPYVVSLEMKTVAKLKTFYHSSYCMKNYCTLAK